MKLKILYKPFLTPSAKKATPGPPAQCNNSYNPQQVVMIEAKHSKKNFHQTKMAATT